MLALLKDYVLVIRLLKHPVVRENKWRQSSLVGKSVQTSTECNKLIMVSRVPGYGQLDYLVLEYHVNLITLLLINVVGF